MNRKSLFVVLLSVFTLSTFAQQKIKDVRTNPDLYFLQADEVANSLELLPAPPQPGSILWMNDEAQYQWGKLQRNTPRGDQAAADARVNGDGVPNAFSEAFGIRISKETTPEIYKLVLGMREDAGDLATRAAKNYYMRVRPFAFYHETTCNPEQQQELSTNGSYPSGHTAIGWATALILSEINIDRQNEILKRGMRWGRAVSFVAIISRAMSMQPALCRVQSLPACMPTRISWPSSRKPRLNLPNSTRPAK